MKDRNWVTYFGHTRIEKAYGESGGALWVVLGNRSGAIGRIGAESISSTELSALSIMVFGCDWTTFRIAWFMRLWKMGRSETDE